MNRIKEARDFAKEAHRKQKRNFTGSPYFLHLEETFQILWDITEGKDKEDIYIAAVLHDTVEDTAVTIDEINKNFGKAVGDLVAELTTDNKIVKEIGKKEYLSCKINEMSEDAFTIKLCDRLSNVMGLDDKAIPDSFALRYILETQYILEHIERKMNEPQKHLTKRIEGMLVFLKINRNL